MELKADFFLFPALVIFNSNLSNFLNVHFEWYLFLMNSGSLKECRSSVTRDTGPSSSQKRARSSSVISTRETCQVLNGNEGTLSYEELQALDDYELANVVIFGNRSFRPLQHQACKAFVQKQDCFILLPTGGGKSLCYQVFFFVL